MLLSSVLGAVAKNATLPVAPLVVSVSLLRPFEATNPEDTCFQVAPSVHPALKERFGITLGSWRRLSMSDIRCLMESLGRIPVFLLENDRASRISLQQFAGLNSLPVRVINSSGFSIHVRNVSKNSASVRLNLRELKISALTLPLGGLQLSLSSLRSLQDSFLVIDETKETLLSIYARYRNSVSVSRSPHSPGVALVRVSDHPPFTASPKEAVERLAHLQEHYDVFCQDAVADLAACQSAPPVFDRILQPHQQSALGALSSVLPRQILALEPGSGKTVVCCRLLSHHARRSVTQTPSLVCVPKTLVSHWVDSLERFAPELTVFAPSSAKQAEMATSKDSDFHVVVLSPQVLKGVSRSDRHRMLIVDEAHKLVSGDSTYKLLKELTSLGDRVVLVTGTPDASHRINKRLSTLLLGYALQDNDFTWTDNMGPYVIGGSSATLPDLVFSTAYVQPSRSDRESDAVSAARLSAARAAMESSPSPATRMLYQNAVNTERLSKCSPAMLLGKTALPGAKEDYIVSRAAKEPVVVCCGSTVTARLLSERLSDRIEGVMDVSRIDPKSRARSVSDLDSSVRVVVVPDDMMLGLNIPQISTVLHADIPASRAVSLQRSARSRRLDSGLKSVESVFLAIVGSSECESLPLVFPGGDRPS